MLTIRHATGALAGTETEIEPGKDRVLFGRQLECDVHYPPEETSVARRHFALVRKPSGSWTVELFGEPFVAINGLPADNGQVVHDGAKFELGRIGGPSFAIGVKEDARTDNYLRTVAQEAAPSPRMIAVRADTLARFARRIAAVAVVIAVGGGAFAAYSYVSTRITTQRLDAAQKEFSDALAREANLRIGAEVRTHLARAVYNVQLQDAQGRAQVGGGTAWVVGPNLLATNAHVAIARQGLRPGERMVVRAPGENGAVYEVIEHRLHPGYVTLEAFVQGDLRLFGGYRGLKSDRLSGNGYDVALLRTKETLPENARLELATDDELNALASGTPLATAGFPVEKLANTWALARGATPELHIGVVTSVTDMFGLPSPQPQRQLVHHDLPITGGQSGSPVVGASGRVVAVINSMNALPAAGGGRQPSAALINFGQRADLVRDMLDGTAEKKLAEARTYWEQVAKNFDHAKDFFPQLVVQDARAMIGLGEGVQPRLLAEINTSMVASSGERIRRQGKDEATGAPYDFDLFKKYFVSPQVLPVGYDYLFLVIGEGGSTGLNLEIDQQVAAYNNAPNYPFIICRLLAPTQQNTGDPKNPRPACATGNHRLEAMRIPAGDSKSRDVDVVIFNNRVTDDTLANSDLKYVLRIYQWVPRAASR